MTYIATSPRGATFKRSKLVREELEQAYRLVQDHHDALAEDYRNGATAKQLAVKYRVMDTYPLSRGNSQTAAESITRFALRGNESEKLGPVFSGAVPRDELESENGRRQGIIATKALEHITDDMRRVNAYVALEKRGVTRWDPAEEAFIWLLSGDSEFRTKNGERVKNASIAVEANRYFHEGETVRKASTVSLKLLGMERAYTH